MMSTRTLSLLALLGLTFCTTKKEQAEKHELTPKPPTNLTVLYQAERQGVITPCTCKMAPHGGIDREYNAVEKVRSQNPGRVVYLDAGSMFAPKDQRAGTDDMKRLIKIVNILGIDAYAPSAADYALGLSDLDKAKSEARFPFVSTNVWRPNGDRAYEPYTVIERSGTKILVMGIADPGQKIIGVKIADPFPIVKNILADKGKEADLVILLSSVPQVSSHPEFQSLTGIHLVISGTETLALDNPMWVSEGKTLLVDPFPAGRSLGRLDVRVTTPFVGWQNGDELARNLEELKALEAMKGETTNPKLLASIERDIARLKSNALIAPIKGGSAYAHQKVALTKEDFGTRNLITVMMPDYRAEPAVAH